MIPVDLDGAIEMSKINNPNLIISRLEYEQSEKDVTIARSDLSTFLHLCLLIVQSQTI